ncbi:MAG: hypothetical protein PHX34_03700 [Candidatus Shapirobacteria bacterium]|nr:hypothetical protein [Candidatus Shapirobacteria bacterium]
MHFICRSFIGKSDSQNWSQYWENEPDDFQLKSQKGHLFGLISLHSDAGEDIKNIGHDLIFEINQNYFSNDSTLDILSSLKKTITNIKQNSLYQEHQIEVVLVVISDKKVFIVSFGPNKIALSRDSKISLLIKGDKDMNFISGPIQFNDRIFFMTSEFFTKITWDKIKSILFDDNIQNIEENILSLLYSFDNQNHLSAALIEINDEIISPDISVSVEDSEKEVISDQLLNPPTEEVKSVFITNQQPRQISQRKRIQIIIAIILLIGLFVSSFFGYQKNKKINTETKYQQLKTELESQLNNITLVKSINLEAAQTGAKESQNIITQMANLSIHPDEVNQFKSQVDTILSQTGVNENFIPDLFFDTSMIVSNPQYNDIFLSQNNLYLLDSTNGRVDTLNITEKSSKNTINSEKIKSATKIFSDSNNIYLSYKDNISQINGTSIDQKILFSDSDPVPNPSDIQIWNGSIYLLDATNSTIWKFTPTSDTFSKAQNWLKNDKNLDLGPTSLSIDGKIWVLYQSGVIENYISGVKDNFKLSGSNQFNQASILDVSLEDDGYITFVDDQNLIFVYKKSGDFVAKYNLNKLKVLDLVLNKNILYILSSDQKIYKITP